MFTALTPILFGILSNTIRLCYAYPIIFEAVHQDRTCMDIHIPDGDDAHLVFLPLPENVNSETEDWFVQEVGELTRPNSVQFLKTISSVPSNIQLLMRGLKERSRITVSVDEDGHKPVTKNQQLIYFRPTFIKDITKNSRGWNENRGNFRICVSARGPADVRIIFDTVKISEYTKQHIVKKEHLTPLEEAFEESVHVAKTILDEMHYMEKREVRMKKTADGTNSRIRYFSYISITVLLGVTWIQITYLKGYFKKKKVL